MEHFAPKSRAVADIYEWSNYRLVCAKMNGSKSDFTDVLDPFLLESETFVLDVLEGGLHPSSTLTPPVLAAAQDTIKRLKLDDPELRTVRKAIITDYFEGEFSTAFLKRESPFIHFELARQSLLRP